MNTTLPTDSTERKDYALFSGCLRYFPAALAGVAKTSKLGNDKHNPGQEMHHARNKSGDHGDCILRHLMDLSDLLASNDRGESDDKEMILTEASSLAWRALALSQELHEKFGAPIAPGARGEKPNPGVDLHIAAEKAQAEVSERIASNKRDIWNKPKTKFSPCDVVKHINNDAEVTVEGTYFDVDGKPILFVKDSNGKVYGVDPAFYKSIYAEKEAK